MRVRRRSGARDRSWQTPLLARARTFERALKLFARRMQARMHGAYRDVEQLCDVLAALALDFEQREDGALLEAEFFHQLIELPARLLRRSLVFGRMQRGVLGHFARLTLPAKVSAAPVSRSDAK